nr:MAG TPA: hypothetical protein [Caudoviricetes sp.]
MTLAAMMSAGYQRCSWMHPRSSRLTCPAPPTQRSCRRA